MRGSSVLALCAAIASLCSTVAVAQNRPLPHLQRNGEATQLMVDGQPYLMIGGELHNSSASSPAYMAPIWDKLEKNHVRTVIGVASWELVEPEEGRYDFTALDDQIRQAEARGIKLVMIWFAGYKNADSVYTPSWVRRDTRRFPRVERDPNIKLKGIVAYLGLNPTVSPFSENLVQADARAFAAMMRHIKQVDKNQTVIMVQVENEVGLLGDSRDRSPIANAAWAKPVPPALIAYMRANRAKLRPELTALWQRGGFRERGTWAEVFGTDKAAEEVFMAWGYASYIERVAKAGSAEYGLPMYANAWLGPTPGATEPGDWPSGGPNAHVMDVWKAAAPTLVLLAPDIYIPTFSDVLANFKRADNPIFVPEARPDVGNLFLTIGKYAGIGFAPFGIDSVADSHELFGAYKLINEMTGQIARAQAAGTIRGFRLGKGEKATETVGGYTFDITGPVSTVGAMGAGTGAEAQQAPASYGMILAGGKDEFFIVGHAISVKASAPGAVVEVDSAQEGVFDKGRWVPGRTMNGDERYALFPREGLRIIRMTLLRR